MTRTEALERVVEAARRWNAAYQSDDYETDGGDERMALSDAIEAFDLLDALPPAPQPQPAGEVAEVELWAHRDGDICVLLPGSAIVRDWATNQFRTRLGTTFLTIQKEPAR